MRKEMTWGCESRNALHTVFKLEGRVDRAEGGCSRLNVAYSQSSAQQGSTVDSFIIQFSHYITRLF